MNGESAFGWIKALAVLLIVIVIGVLIFKGAAFLKSFAQKLKDFASFGGGFDAHNPLGNLVDRGVSAATGGDSLGTWLASKFDPATRAADISVRNVKPISIPINDNYIGDFALDSSPGFVSNNSGAVTGILRKP